VSPSYKVVIPYYKNTTQLEKCKASLPSNTKPIVIDDSLTAKGFTASVNKGLKEVLAAYTPTEYVIILNQDCYLEEGAVKKMLAFMEAHPKCALAGIKQLSSKNQDQIIHGGTKQCYPNGIHEGGLVSKGDCAVSKQVPWVNGACIIARMEAVKEFGLMDPNFKMFASDSDWSYTARARGWETWYIADVSCVHEQGVSKSQDKKMSNIFEADTLYFRDKWINGEVYRDLSLEIF
jgi:GT2 family glycosyltransferase